MGGLISYLDQYYQGSSNSDNSILRDSIFNITILITGLGGRWIHELCRSELASGIMVSWGRWELACIFLRWFNTSVDGNSKVDWTKRYLLLWGRIFTRNTLIPLDCPFYLMGIRPTPRESRTSHKLYLNLSQEEGLDGGSRWFIYISTRLTIVGRGFPSYKKYIPIPSWDCCCNLWVVLRKHDKCEGFSLSSPCGISRVLGVLCRRLSSQLGMVPAFVLGILNRMLGSGMEGHESPKFMVLDNSQRTRRPDPYLTCEWLNEGSENGARTQKRFEP